MHFLGVLILRLLMLNLLHRLHQNCHFPVHLEHKLMETFLLRGLLHAHHLEVKLVSSLFPIEIQWDSLAIAGKIVLFNLRVIEMLSS